MKATVEIEEVTPKMANEWLENRLEGQRSIRDTHVARLATDIIEGRFRLTCDALAIIKGKLGNGQHRCAAIAISGKTCKCLVLRTDDEKLFGVIDSGISRTAADALMQLNHHNAQVVAAAARIICMYDKGLLTRFGSSQMKKTIESETELKITVVSRGDIISYSQTHADTLMEFSKLACDLYREKSILPKSLSCAFLEIAARKNKEKAIEFISHVYRGDTTDIAYLLRERFIKNKILHSNAPQSYQFGLLIKAFKAFLSGVKLEVLKIVDGEPFPKL